MKKVIKMDTIDNSTKKKKPGRPPGSKNKSPKQKAHLKHLRSAAGKEEVNERLSKARAARVNLSTYNASKEYTIEEMEEFLQPQYITFARHYVVHLKPTEAVRAAGYKSKIPYVQFAQLMKHPAIHKYIELLKKDIERTCHITKFKNVQELSKIAYSNITDLYKDWYTLEEFEKLTPEQKACIQSIKKTTNKFGTTVEIKLHDKRAAIETLNKMLGYDAATKLDVVTTADFGEDPVANIRKALGLSDLTEKE